MGALEIFDATTGQWQVQGGGSSSPGVLAAATDTTQGVVELATVAEATAGTDTTRAVTPAGVAAAVAAGGSGGGSGLPAGVMLDFAGASAPSGYLLCDGSAVSRATYATLFAAIGTTWGSGDGSTTFNVPDFRDRIPIGAGTQTVGQTDALAAGSARVASHSKDHAHSGSSASAGDHTHGTSMSPAGGHSHTGSTDSQGAHTHTIATAATQGYNAGNLGGSVNRNAAASTDSAGAHTHSVTTSTQADHSHSISTPNAGSHTHGITVNSSGQARDAYAVVTKIIKT